MPVDELALDLKPHHQKEDGHQGVVDPVQDAERTEIGMKGGEVGGRQSRVRHGKGRRRGDHQGDPAARFAAEERPMD